MRLGAHVVGMHVGVQFDAGEDVLGAPHPPLTPLQHLLGGADAHHLAHAERLGALLGGEAAPRLQVAGIALGFLTPWMFAVGGGFAALFLVEFMLGKKIEQR